MFDVNFNYIVMIVNKNDIFGYFSLAFFEVYNSKLINEKQIVLSDVFLSHIIIIFISYLLLNCMTFNMRVLKVGNKVSE